MDFTPMHLRRFLGEEREDLPVYGFNRHFPHSEPDPSWRKYRAEEIRQKRRFDGFKSFEDSPEGQKFLDTMNRGLVTQNEFDAAKKKWETDASWRENDKLEGKDPGTRSEEAWAKPAQMDSMIQSRMSTYNRAMNDKAAEADRMLDAQDAERQREMEIDRERRKSDMEDWMRGRDPDYEDGQA